MSDQNERLARVEEKAGNIAANLESHLDDCQKAQEKLSRRVFRLEIALYTAMGGMIVILWLINKASHKILMLLGSG